MITDEKSLLALRKSLAAYVKQLSEELVYWMEELNQLEEAAAVSGSGDLAARDQPGPELSWSSERESGPTKPRPVS